MGSAQGYSRCPHAQMQVSGGGGGGGPSRDAGFEQTSCGQLGKSASE